MSEHLLCFGSWIMCHAPFEPFGEEPVQQENVAVAEGLNAEETGEQEDVEGH